MSLGQEVKCTLSYPYQLLQAGSCTTLILADFYQTACNSPSDKPPHLTACQLPKARAKQKTWGSCESRFSAAGVGRGETSMGTSAAQPWPWAGDAAPRAQMCSHAPPALLPTLLPETNTLSCFPKVLAWLHRYCVAQGWDRCQQLLCCPGES